MRKTSPARLFFFPALCALMFAAMACSQISEGPFPVYSTPQAAAEESQAFVNLEPDLVGKISVDRHGQQRDSAGKIILQATIRNRTDFRQAIEIQTAFRDAQGFDIRDVTAWERFILGPNETMNYHANSLDGRAARYVVRFRPAR